VAIRGYFSLCQRAVFLRASDQVCLRNGRVAIFVKHADPMRTWHNSRGYFSRGYFIVHKIAVQKNSRAWLFPCEYLPRKNTILEK